MGSAFSGSLPNVGTMRRKRLIFAVLLLTVGLLLQYTLHTGQITLQYKPERHITKHVAVSNDTSKNKTVIKSNVTNSNNTSTESLYPWMRLREKRLTSYNYTFLSSPKGLCTEPPHIIILCLTQYKSMDRRKAIRETWGSVVNNTVGPFRIVFLLGKPENETDMDTAFKENLKYNDIVQTNFQDTYRNLTIKVLMGLKWVSLNCPEANFILKVDDDTFVNLPVLGNLLMKYNVTEKGLLLGTIKRKAPVLRTGKFALNRELYPASFFPTYLSGQAYVISGNVAGVICDVSEYFPYFFVEDAFITGHVRQVLNIDIKHLRGFPTARRVAPGPCTFYVRNNVAHSYASVQDMNTVWQSLQDKGVEKCCKMKRANQTCHPYDRNKSYSGT